MVTLATVFARSWLNASTSSHEDKHLKIPFSGLVCGDLRSEKSKKLKEKLVTMTRVVVYCGPKVYYHKLSGRQTCPENLVKIAWLVWSVKIQTLKLLKNLKN